MRPRKQPKPEIIEYKQLKAAAGGGGSGGSRGGRGPSGGGGGGGFRPGQNLHCKVIKEEPGGYAMVIVTHNLPAFLPTQALLRPGDEILAQFVCVHNNRILLSARFSNNVSNLPSAQAVRWEDHLVIDQSATLPYFSFNSSSTPRKFHYKRATDLIMTPMDSASLNEFKIADYDLEWLITDLEGGMKTGCVKAWCKRKLSRSAILLYRGRVVGCIYSCKSEPDTQTTEKSLQKMLGDLEIPDSDVQGYDLPENITLAISALFLGYPVQRNDDYDARAYMDYICAWFESKGITACLAITLPSNSATCLGYVYKGQFCGAFYVEDQQFKPDKEFVYELLRNDPRANVEASILPTEMTSAAIRFGFSLSLAKKQKDAGAGDI